VVFFQVVLAFRSAFQKALAASLSTVPLSLCIVRLSQYASQNHLTASQSQPAVRQLNCQQNDKTFFHF